MVLEVLRALGRRWYVVLVGLLLTCGLGLGAWRTSPPEYHARGLVLLLPSASTVGKGGNPFLQLSGLEQPAGILVAYFSSAPAIEEVRSVSPTAEYQVGIEDSTRGPVIAVDVTAQSAEETTATLRHLVGGIPQELARLQQQVHAPPGAAIGSMALTVDTKAQVSRAGTYRTLIAALVVGLAGTGALAFGIDSLSERRRNPGEVRAKARRRRARSDASPRAAGQGEADRPVHEVPANPPEPSWAGRKT